MARVIDPSPRGSSHENGCDGGTAARIKGGFVAWWLTEVASVSCSSIRLNIVVRSERPILERAAATYEDLAAAQVSRLG